MAQTDEVHQRRRGAGGGEGRVAPDGPPVVRTPIPITARTRTILAAVAGLVLVGLVWQAPTVPRLILFGGALALALSFPVRLLQRLVPRPAAIAVVVIGLLLLVAVSLVVVIPLGIVQLQGLVGELPEYAAEGEAALGRGVAWLAERGWVDGNPDEVIADARGEILARAQGAAEQVAAGALDGLFGAFGMLLQLFGVLLVAVYLLADVGRFKAILIGVAPTRFRDDMESLWWHLEQSLSRYLGGLLISITVQATAAGVALWLLGVPYPLLLALWMAVTAILPYVGAFLGGIPAVAVALFVSPTTAVLTALVYVVINQVEGNLLTPRIQGDAVRVHPLLVFLGVVAGGEVGGLVGAALAVPTMAILRVLVDFFGDRLYVPRPAVAGRGVTAALTAGRLERDADAAEGEDGSG